jgi:hypothetical protein
LEPICGRTRGLTEDPGFLDAQQPLEQTHSCSGIAKDEVWAVAELSLRVLGSLKQSLAAREPGRVLVLGTCDQAPDGGVAVTKLEAQDDVGRGAGVRSLQRADQS